MNCHALVLLILLLAPTVKADLLISTIDEDSLPYDLSPRKYDNSPSKYDNSVSKYQNSPSKYSNSPSKYGNSPSKYSNGHRGDQRLLMEEGGELYRVGYYVHSDSGVINFFSPSGSRMFYNPEDWWGVFHGTEGFFCGVLVIVDGKYRLVLTEAGKKTLLLAQ